MLGIKVTEIMRDSADDLSMAKKLDVNVGNGILFEVSFGENGTIEMMNWGWKEESLRDMAEFCNKLADELKRRGPKKKKRTF